MHLLTKQNLYNSHLNFRWTYLPSWLNLFFYPILQTPKEKKKDTKKQHACEIIIRGLRSTILVLIGISWPPARCARATLIRKTVLCSSIVDFFYWHAITSKDLIDLESCLMTFICGICKSPSQLALVPHKLRKVNPSTMKWCGNGSHLWAQRWRKRGRRAGDPNRSRFWPINRVRCRNHLLYGPERILVQLTRVWRRNVLNWKNSWGNREPTQLLVGSRRRRVSWMNPCSTRSWCGGNACELLVSEKTTKTLSTFTAKPREGKRRTPIGNSKQWGMLDRKEIRGKSYDNWIFLKSYIQKMMMWLLDLLPWTVNDEMNSKLTMEFTKKEATPCSK